MAGATSSAACIFCQIVRNSTSTPLLHSVCPQLFFVHCTLRLVAEDDLSKCPDGIINLNKSVDILRNQTGPFRLNSSYIINFVYVFLLQDDKVVAFEDIKPSAYRHYLVIPIDHIPSVRALHRRDEDYSLVRHMLNVGQALVHRDAPQSIQYRFGFHQPPLNSVNHLHLHCLALPFIPRWKCVKYLSLGPFGGFIEAEKLLEKIKPLSPISS